MRNAKQRYLKSRKRTKPASAKAGFDIIGNEQTVANGSLICTIIGNYATNVHIVRDEIERGK